MVTQPYMSKSCQIERHHSFRVTFAQDQERLAAEAEAKSTSWIATSHSLKMNLLDKNG